MRRTQAGARRVRATCPRRVRRPPRARADDICIHVARSQPTLRMQHETRATPQLCAAGAAQCALQQRHSALRPCWRVFGGPASVREYEEERVKERERKRERESERKTERETEGGR